MKPFLQYRKLCICPSQITFNTICYYIIIRYFGYIFDLVKNMAINSWNFLLIHKQVSSYVVPSMLVWKMLLMLRGRSDLKHTFVFVPLGSIHLFCFVLWFFSMLLLYFIFLHLFWVTPFSWYKTHIPLHLGASYCVKVKNNTYWKYCETRRSIRVIQLEAVRYVETAFLFPL